MHSARWHAPTPARTFGRPPCTPVSMNVAQEAWSVVPPTVMASALHSEWSLKEQLVTLQSATCVLIGIPPRVPSTLMGDSLFPNVGRMGPIKKTQLCCVIDVIAGARLKASGGPSPWHRQSLKCIPGRPNQRHECPLSISRRHPMDPLRG